MSGRRGHQVDEQPTYRYTFTGATPAVFADLTAVGVGLVEPGADIEVPVLIAHADLEPADKATAAAVGELLEWADALAVEANAPEISDVDEDQVDVVDEAAVDEPDNAGDAAAVMTEEH